MARKADILYVHHYYTDGTAAKKVAVKPEHKKKPLPLFEPAMLEPDQKITVKLDPLSMGAALVAMVLVVMMVVSLFQYSSAHRRRVELQKYVYTLSDENIRLEQAYESGYDLEEIKVQALALGMIPIEQAQTIQVRAAAPVPSAEPTGWERFQWFMSELFA